MNPILTNNSNEALSEANLENLIASTTLTHGYPGADIYRRDDISWCITDIKTRPCNVVFKARLQKENADEVIERIIGKAKERGVPIRWYVDQHTTPVDLDKMLIRHGFIADNPVPMMAVGLNVLQSEKRGLTGLEVIEVRDTGTLKIWENTCARGFGGNPDGPTPIFRWLTHIIENDLPIRFFLAMHNGIPVATAQLTIASGVAGLDRIATVPEARNQGIGYAITLSPLLIAKELGYKIGVLQASSDGERVYSRMGFQRCGEVTNYHWIPPEF